MMCFIPKRKGGRRVGAAETRGSAPKAGPDEMREVRDRTSEKAFLFCSKCGL